MTGKGTSMRLNPVFALRGRKAFAAVFLTMFVLGYNLTLAQIQPSYANYSGTAPTKVPNSNPPNVGAAQCPGSGPPWCTSGSPCDGPPGIAQTMANTMIQDLLTNLKNASNQLETKMWDYMNNVLIGAYDQQMWLDQKMIDGWNTFWYYNLLPGMQSMTRQLNVGLAQQAFQIEANEDVGQAQSLDRELAKHEQDDMGVNGGGKMCIAATMSGGFVKTKMLGRAMRVVWERNSLAAGLNEKDDSDTPTAHPYPGASSRIGSYVAQYNDYLNIFCDPHGNGGKNYCLKSATLKPPLYNADVEPSKYIYNNLTIPMDSQSTVLTPTPDNASEGADVATAVNDIINNMVGIPAEEPMSPGALASVVGHEEWLGRRSYLARYAAIRSIPDLVASWRVPGSGSRLAGEITDLRNSLTTGAPGNYTGPVSMMGGFTSRDPSYKDIMHAVSIDQFNSGQFALGMMTNENRLQMEKLNLSAFYLMQLRDYYKLLERTALTLAVQVSLRDEDQMNSLYKVFEAAPIK